ncbi:MAG TPA: ATP-binding protein [Pyrinomonadaceae bacterium]|nr:ATP-binding protein [Pyrinomonadaceae bacterium]
MTIRARLLWLTLGLIIPLILVGFFNLWSFWQVTRTQLDESLERQAELAASAFEQRLLAHRQTLETISMLAASDENSFTLKDYLDSIVKTRPEWLDVQIVDAGGKVLLSQTNKNLNLQADSVNEIKDEAARENTFVISTEQSVDQKLRLLSLAQPVGNGNFVVARIDGANASEVFEKRALPEDNIIAVFDKNNRLLYRSRVSPEQMSLDVSETPLFTALNEKREGTIEVESPYDKIRRVYGLARVETANSTVAVAVPSRKLYEPARQLFIRQLLFSLPIVALAILAAFLIARSIARPMRLLALAARRFGAGDLTARAEVTQSGSIGELGTTFNQMAQEIAQREEELKTLDRMKSEFVSNVSHELRTPLTTIKTFVRVLQSDKISAAEREEYLETIAAECDRQIDFVQNLLDLSRIESGAYKISLAPTDVVKILWEAIETHGRAAVSRRLNLKFNSPDGDLPPARTDAGALRQIISSLIENAMKYTPEGGEITIAANLKDERIAVEIADDGCGIAAADLPRIFEKFYRGQPLGAENPPFDSGEFSDESECVGYNESPGVGLGLYLVHNLVEQIGGEITAESPVDHEKKRGSKFTVRLPVSGTD